MIVRCSHCKQCNEIEDDRSFKDSCCTNCGCSLNLADDPNATIFSEPSATQFGHFRLLEILGNGAFGTVWKTFDEQLDRAVALKMLY